MKNEHLTRKEIIDNRLKQAGWDISDRSQVIEEFDIIVDPGLIREASTPYSGHQYSDYVLLGKDGKPLAVVEAKKTSADAAIGREQAKQYCYNILSNQGGDLPSAFIRTDMISIFGIWKTIHLKRYMDFLREMISNFTYTSEMQEKV